MRLSNQEIISLFLLLGRRFSGPPPKGGSDRILYDLFKRIELQLLAISTPVVSSILETERAKELFDAYLEKMNCPTTHEVGKEQFLKLDHSDPLEEQKYPGSSKQKKSRRS